LNSIQGKHNEEANNSDKFVRQTTGKICLARITLTGKSFPTNGIIN